MSGPYTCNESACPIFNALMSLSIFDTYSSPCSLLEELEERSDSEVKSQEAQLRIFAKEKTSLVTKLTG